MSAAAIIPQTPPQIKVENDEVVDSLKRVADSTSEGRFSSDDPPPSESPRSEVFGTPQPNYASVNDDPVAEDPGTIATASPKKHQCSREDELSAFRSQSAHEIDFWKAQYFSTLEDNARLRSEKDALVVEFGANRVALDGFLESQATIDKLFKRIDLQKQVHGIKRKLSDSVEELDISDILKTMQYIRIRLRDLFKEGKFGSLSGLPELARDHPLKALVEQAFGLDLNSTDTSYIAETYRRSEDMRQCTVLALTGAALAMWVFQEGHADLVFDRFQDCSSRYPINRYRQALDLIAAEGKSKG